MILTLILGEKSKSKFGRTAQAEIQDEKDSRLVQCLLPL
jgi:hypothetical protein